MCVAECLCLIVSAFSSEPFDVQTKNLVEGLTLKTSQMNSKVNVIGQGP